MLFVEIMDGPFLELLASRVNFINRIELFRLDIRISLCSVDQTAIVVVLSICAP
jgi:hypothetical protein